MKRLIAAALFCLAVFPAYAGNYLAADAIPPTLLPGPWKEGSAEWRKDVQEIVELQKKATPEEINAAAAEMHMNPEMLTVVLGPEVTSARYPYVFSLLDKAGEDAKAINKFMKVYWKTRRPYMAAASEVKALIEAQTSPSYPSGHTCGSLVWTEILGELFPDKGEALRSRAEEIAYHRVLAGMHYPVDITGGRALGRLILGALWMNPKFRQDFEAARKEVAWRKE